MAAVLQRDGTLSYSGKKLPWFPREFLQPMVEEKLAIGDNQDCNDYLNSNFGRINKISSWQDYFEFAKEFYESIINTSFNDFNIKNLELEEKVYIFADNTIDATVVISNFYDAMLEDYQPSKLYENFISLDFKSTTSLVPNQIEQMKEHLGQMTGEYSLSVSHRESVNYFNCMEDGKILAVNGPPGTVKTTLLQSTVATMYVQKALKKETPPLIVASSTNNQAVTNIIEFFSKIPPLEHKNLGQR